MEEAKLEEFIEMKQMLKSLANDMHEIKESQKQLVEIAFEQRAIRDEFSQQRVDIEAKIKRVHSRIDKITDKLDELEKREIELDKREVVIDSLVLKVKDLENIKREVAVFMFKFFGTIILTGSLVGFIIFKLVK